MKVGQGYRDGKCCFRVSQLFFRGMRRRILLRGIESPLMSQLKRPSVDAARQDGPSGPGGETPIFTPKPEERGGLPLAAWGVAALIVVVVVGALAIAGRKKPAPVPNTVQPGGARSPRPP